MLLLPGTKFKVTSVQPGDAYTVVTAQQVTWGWVPGTKPGA